MNTVDMYVSMITLVLLLLDIVCCTTARVVFCISSDVIVDIDNVGLY